MDFSNEKIIGKVIEISNDDILPNRFQPRKYFEEAETLELADSIKEHGILQPIVVRQVGDKYEIIAGERRFKANILAGNETIPAIVNNLNDKESSEIAIIENIQRQNLTPIEEAISYKRIIDMGYITQEKLARKIGKSQSAIANKIRLLKLSDNVQEALMSKKISERHARSLLKLDSLKKQDELLEKIIKERLTVRKTDEEIENMNNENNLNNQENMFTTNVASQQTVSMPTYQTELSNQPVQSQEITSENISLSDNVTDIGELTESNSALSEVENQSISPIMGIPISDLTGNIEESPKDEIISLDDENIINTIDQVGQETEAEQVAQSMPEVASTPVEQVAQSMPEVASTPVEQVAQSMPEVASTPVEQVAQSMPEVASTPVEQVAQSMPEATSTPVEQVAQSMPEVASTPVEQVAQLMPEAASTPVEQVAQSMPEAASTPDISTSNDIPNIFDGNLNTETVISSSTPIIEEEGIAESSEVPDVPTFAPEQTNDNSFTSISEDTPIGPIENDSTLEDSIESPIQNVADPIIVTNNDNQFDPIMPEEGPQEPTLDFKTIINLIRQCSQTIEKCGYKIDTEEYDLEGKYQVTFVIEK